ncbi:MAG TPA: hypothetical protein VIZ28_09940 [Chitinophagaceae bacterium]
MKKLFVLGAILTLFVVSASAQVTSDRVRRERTEKRIDRSQLTRPEKFRLHKNDVRFKAERRRALRDGRVNPSERRRLHNMKRHNRHETYRLKHNNRRRVI